MASSASSASSKSWMDRVSTAQSQRLSPEMRAEVLARAERQRHTEMTRRKSHAVKAHSMRSRALCAEGLRQISTAASEDIEATRTRWSTANAVSESRQERMLCMLSEQPAPSAQAVALRDDSDEDAEALEAVANTMGGDAQQISADAEATAGPESGVDAVAIVMEQLRTEPADARECAAKFMLYEEYATQVEKMRESVFKLFEESRSGLPSAVEADMDRQLKGIDRQETMGIPEETREWFVFHMMKAAEANNRRMAAILDGFERKLEFLTKNDQAECPVCFEEFDEASPTKAPETLGCCHRVCKECWTNWCAVMRGQPFCPLCRNGEFLGVVMARGSQ